VKIFIFHSDFLTGALKEAFFLIHIHYCWSSLGLEATCWSNQGQNENKARGMNANIQQGDQRISEKIAQFFEKEPKQCQNNADLDIQFQRLISH
jgi:hypothetical protein